MTDIIKVPVKIRRFDLFEKPDLDLKQLELNLKFDYNSLKQYLQNCFELTDDDDKVIKLRNEQFVLLPLMNLLQPSYVTTFIIDIAKIQHTTRSTANLQDAYLDAVRHKIKNIENRVTEVELLMPQIQLKRQAHMDKTVQNMSTRVAFLNKRIDDLTPPQWKSKMPITIS
ncbi:hypothetical protein FQR65_LT12910 [Abscondita terminalis]|nr:hypothetical protein FQR65_LT12910 [Abscondita terminalis]